MKSKTDPRVRGEEAVIKAENDKETPPCTPRLDRGGPEKVKIVRRWGVDGDLVLQRLQGKVINITLPSGDVVTGVLVGYNEWTLTLTVNGEGLLFNKSYFVSVKLAT